MRSVFFSLASTGGNLKKAPQEIIVFPMTNTMGWGWGGGGGDHNLTLCCGT